MFWILFQMLLFCLSVEATTSTPPPHVLLIVADDYGHNDIGYQQNSPTTSNLNPNGLNTTNVKLLTPTLDRLASEGMKLNNYYVQPLCSPTRGTILTGRYPSHTGIGPNVIRPTHPYAMPKREVLIAEKFKQAGYSTHIVGKWHLGICDERYTPTFRGFDSFTGYLLGAEDYYYHNRSDSGYHGLDLRNTTNLFNSSNVFPKATHDAYGIYSTDVFTNEVERIVSERDLQVNPKPLFLYMPFQSVHGPLQAPIFEMNKYPSVMNTARRKYAGMVSALDDAVLKIETIYKKYQIWNNTLMIFTTDNGGPLKSANNFPLRGHKATSWEGGVRGISFVRGLNVPGNTVTQELMHSTDWYATLSSVAGYDITYPTQPLPLDGVNQWNILTGATDANGKLLKTSRLNIMHNCPGSTEENDLGGAYRSGVYKLLMASKTMQVNSGMIQTPPPGNRLNVPWVPPAELICPPPKGILMNGVVSWLFHIRDDPKECVNIIESSKEMYEKVYQEFINYKKTAVSDLALMYGTSDPASNPKKRWDKAWGPWSKRSNKCKWL